MHMHVLMYAYARSLDMLSVLLTKTRQTLAKDATLTAFEDVIMETLSVSICSRRGEGDSSHRACYNRGAITLLG